MKYFFRFSQKKFLRIFVLVEKLWNESRHRRLEKFDRLLTSRLFAGHYLTENAGKRAYKNDHVRKSIINK